MNEEQVLKSRLKDLAKKAYQQNIYTYSTFLTPAELAVPDELEAELSYVDYVTFGGGDICERQMVRFGSEEMFGYQGVWPISIIRVEPLVEKFSDELTHRDFLGAVMNLGIDRNVVGDILVKKNKRAYIFCQDTIADFIAEQLVKIKHTNVRCILLEYGESVPELAPEFEDVDCIVAAPRFDAIIAALIKCSRSEALNLFRAKKVTLNGRISERNSMNLKDGDIFSVRGYGKFIYCGSGRETRKGKIYIHVKKYV